MATRRDADHPQQAISTVESELTVIARLMEHYRRHPDPVYKDMDRARYLIARVVHATGPLSIKALASLLALDAATVTRTVASMESRGWILRSQDERDGRVSMISLSETGTKMMKTVQARREERLRGLISDWSNRDLQEFGRLLMKYNRSTAEFIHGAMDSDAQETGMRTVTSLPALLTPGDHDGN